MKLQILKYWTTPLITISVGTSLLPFFCFLLTMVRRTMVHPHASTSGVLPDPACLLCGMLIPNTRRSEFPDSGKSHPLLQESQWKSLWKPGLEHLLVPSREVENTFTINFPRLWSCLCRASESQQVAAHQISPVLLTRLNSYQRVRYQVPFNWYQSDTRSTSKWELLCPK